MPIHKGEILIVDKVLRPAHEKIVIAAIDGEFTVKRLYFKDNQVFLNPENNQFKPIKVQDSADFSIWGFVTYVIHNTQKR